MAQQKDRIGQFKNKYGVKGIDNGMRLHPDHFSEMVEWRDELDPHYAKLWIDYTYGGYYQRGVLTDRVRCWS